ncbi:cupin [Fulvitalea axinellae]|uniref:Cupin n=1 Tax=Fulvitalea axinellae TaxID=1182444 RepID=A0AAU9DA84_9BACT|nr:cupin [Fulvitalea axinellae]
MQTASLLKDLAYGDERPAISVLFESETSKEIRILMRAGQVMKEHKTAFPITVELYRGAVDFGVEGKVLNLVAGDMLSLAPSVPHDLKATEDAIIRLTLSKLDTEERVKDVAKK